MYNQKSPLQNRDLTGMHVKLVEMLECLISDHVTTENRLINASFGQPAVGKDVHKYVEKLYFEYTKERRGGETDYQQARITSLLTQGIYDELWLDPDKVCKPRGSYDKWKKIVTKCRKNPILKMLISASFATPLFVRFGVPPCICHICGGSGTGKTLALMLSRSVWGNPAPGLTVDYPCAANSFTPCIIDEFNVSKTGCSSIGHFLNIIYDSYYEHSIYGTNGSCARNRVFLLAGEEALADMTDFHDERIVVFQAHCDNLFNKGGKIFSVILNNYGYAGMDFLRISSLGRCSLDYATPYKSAILSRYNINEAKAFALSVIMLADRLVGELILMDSTNPLTMEDIGVWLNKENESLGACRRNRERELS